MLPVSTILGSDSEETLTSKWETVTPGIRARVPLRVVKGSHNPGNGNWLWPLVRGRMLHMEWAGRICLHLSGPWRYSLVFDILILKVSG